MSIERTSCHTCEGGLSAKENRLKENSRRVTATVEHKKHDDRETLVEQLTTPGHQVTIA